jgi:hypothetical protein
VLLPAAALPELLVACSSLRCLSLAKQPGLADAEVAAALASCRRLDALDVSGCALLTCAALQAAARLLPGLQELRARGLWRLRDPGLAQLASCRRLRWAFAGRGWAGGAGGRGGQACVLLALGAAWRPGAAADGLQLMASCRCLDLGGCWQLGAGALAAVLRAATCLTQLSVPGCPALGDLLLPDFQLLLAAADGPRQDRQADHEQQQRLRMLPWERLDLSGTSVTGAALLYLGVRAPRLAHLAVDGWAAQLPGARPLCRLLAKGRSACLSPSSFSGFIRLKWCAAVLQVRVPGSGRRHRHAARQAARAAAAGGRGCRGGCGSCTVCTSGAPLGPPPGGVPRGGDAAAAPPAPPPGPPLAPQPLVSLSAAALRPFSGSSTDPGVWAGHFDEGQQPPRPWWLQGKQRCFTTARCAPRCSRWPCRAPRCPRTRRWRLSRRPWAAAAA